MEHAINEGNVSTVDVSHQNNSTLHSVHVYIHHMLAEVESNELGRLVEEAALAAIKAYVK